MIKFFRKNGFPEDIIIETKEYSNEETEFKGFESIVKNKKQEILKKFYHKEMRDRLHWIDGYFTALRQIQK